MSKEKIQIRFDGPDLEEHSIDVSLIGPSLTSLGELVSQSNRFVNGDDIRVKVKLHADLKANCVTLDLAVHWESLYEHVKGLIGNDDVKNAKELLEWIGLIATVSSVTLINAIMWLWKRKRNNEVVVVKKNGDTIVLKVEGTNEKLELQERMYQAALSQSIHEGLRDTFKPLLDDGVNKTTFIHKSGEAAFSKNDAVDFLELSGEELDPESEEQELIGHIVIHAPVFDESSKHWKFRWNDRIESINVSHTSIPETIMRRGKVMVGDAFKVKMGVTEKKTKRGYKQKFSIKEVIQFVPTTYEQPELIWVSSDES